MKRRAVKKKDYWGSNGVHISNLCQYCRSNTWIIEFLLMTKTRVNEDENLKIVKFQTPKKSFCGYPGPGKNHTNNRGKSVRGVVPALGAPGPGPTGRQNLVTKSFQTWKHWATLKNAKSWRFIRGLHVALGFTFLKESVVSILVRCLWHWPYFQQMQIYLRLMKEDREDSVTLYSFFNVKFWNYSPAGPRHWPSIRYIFSGALVFDLDDQTRSPIWVI